MKEDQEDTGTFFFGDVSYCSSEDTSGPCRVVFPVYKEKVQFKVDCGADVTTITSKTYKTMKHVPVLKNTDRGLTTTADAKLNCHGTFKAKIRYKSRHYNLRKKHMSQTVSTICWVER